MEQEPASEGPSVPRSGTTYPLSNQAKQAAPRTNASSQWTFAFAPCCTSICYDWPTVAFFVMPILLRQIELGAPGCRPLQAGRQKLEGRWDWSWMGGAMSAKPGTRL